LAETGIAGAVPVLVMLALWLWSNRRPQAEAWRWWCVAFVGVGLLHSLVENPLTYAGFLGPLALALGVGERAAYRVKRERTLRFATLALVAVGALTLANAVVGYRQTLAWLSGDPGGGLATMHRSILRPYAEMLASSGWQTRDGTDGET